MKLKVKFKYVVDQNQGNSIKLLEEIAKVIKEMANLDESPKWSIELVEEEQEN